MKIVISVLIPGEDTNEYLLSFATDRGWWLPFGNVKDQESIRSAAERIATEVSVRKCLNFNEGAFDTTENFRKIMVWDF